MRVLPGILLALLLTTSAAAAGRDVSSKLSRPPTRSRVLPPPSATVHPPAPSRTSQTDETAQGYHMFDLDQRRRLWTMPPQQPNLGLLGWEGKDAVIVRCTGTDPGCPVWKVSPGGDWRPWIEGVARLLVAGEGWAWQDAGSSWFKAVGKPIRHLALKCRRSDYLPPTCSHYVTSSEGRNGGTFVVIRCRTASNACSVSLRPNSGWPTMSSANGDVESIWWLVRTGCLTSEQQSSLGFMTACAVVVFWLGIWQSGEALFRKTVGDGSQVELVAPT